MLAFVHIHDVDLYWPLSRLDAHKLEFAAAAAYLHEGFMAALATGLSHGFLYLDTTTESDQESFEMKCLRGWCVAKWLVCHEYGAGVSRGGWCVTQALLCHQK